MQYTGIDPGTSESGYIVYAAGAILDAGNMLNDNIFGIIFDNATPETIVVIERAVSRGSIVGRSTFETVEWQARFFQYCYNYGIQVDYLTRQKVINTLISNYRQIPGKAMDTKICNYLKSIYSKEMLSQVKRHAWQALAVVEAYRKITKN